MLPLSAQSDASLRAGAEALQAYIETHPDAPMADVAGTLAVGRRTLPRRLLVLARDAQDAADVLVRQPLDRYFEGVALTDAPALTFMFPGQGAQHPNMGRSFYDSHARYRAVVDDCCEHLRPLLDIDLRTLLYPDLHGRDETEAAALLTQTRYTQPALFVAGYAMVQQLQEWGLAPQAMIGHSIGEYVAACVAGVFSLADALHVVAMRGRLMHGMPPGAMLAVGLEEAALQQHPLTDCDLAAVNAAGMCVLAGTDEAITQVEAQFRGQGIAVSRLRVSQAFHSRMQEPMLAAFESVLTGISLKPPVIPFLSNLTGTWIRPDEAQNPAYWVRQLRGTVRFADGITELLQQEGRVLLDIGPGHTCSAWCAAMRRWAIRRCWPSSRRRTLRGRGLQRLVGEPRPIARPSCRPAWPSSGWRAWMCRLPPCSGMHPSGACRCPCTFSTVSPTGSRFPPMRTRNTRS